MGARAPVHGALPADEPRGRVHRLVPRGVRVGGRRDREPRRVGALLVGDPRRARALRRRPSSRCTSRTSTSARSGDGSRCSRTSSRRGSSARGRTATARRSSSSSEGAREQDRAARAAPAGAAPRRRAAVRARRPGERALPHRPAELELGRSRRAGRERDPLHRLPLREPRARARGRRGRGDRARAHPGDRRAPRRAADPVRGAAPPARALPGARRTRVSTRCRAPASSRG